MKEAAAAQGRVSCRGNAETSSECIIGGRTDDLSQIDETGIEMGLQCKYGITVYIHYSVYTCISPKGVYSYTWRLIHLYSSKF